MTIECEHITKGKKGEYCSLNGKLCSQANCEEGVWDARSKNIKPPKPETEIIKVHMTPKMTALLQDRAREMLFPNRQMYVRSLIAWDLASAGTLLGDIEVIPKSEPMFITLDLGFRGRMEKRAVQLGLRSIGEYFRFLVFQDLDIGGYLEAPPSQEISRRIRK